MARIYPSVQSAWDASSCRQLSQPIAPSDKGLVTCGVLQVNEVGLKTI